ncbi:unnamed protein product [Urochloa humidicola]
MSFDTELILAALNKHFDTVDAMWDRVFAVQDARRDQPVSSHESALSAQASKGVPVRSQFAAVETDVVADNWGGLFDGGRASDEQRHEETIVADNWGGLFEQLAHFEEERDLELPDTPVCVVPVPENDLTSTELLVAADARREAPLTARVTSTTACAAEIVGSTVPLSALRLQQGDAAERESPISPRMTMSSATSIYIKHVVSAPYSSPSAPMARDVEEDDITNTTPTRCSTPVPTLTLVPVNWAVTLVTSSTPPCFMMPVVHATK